MSYVIEIKCGGCGFIVRGVVDKDVMEGEEDKRDKVLEYMLHRV